MDARATEHPSWQLSNVVIFVGELTARLQGFVAFYEGAVGTLKWGTELIEVRHYGQPLFWRR